MLKDVEELLETDQKNYDVSKKRDSIRSSYLTIRSKCRPLSLPLSSVSSSEKIIPFYDNFNILNHSSPTWRLWELYRSLKDSSEPFWMFPVYVYIYFSFIKIIIKLCPVQRKIFLACFFVKLWTQLKFLLPSNTANFSDKSELKIN